MLMDPPKWTTEGEAWAERYGEDRVVFFDTNQPIRMSRACGRWLTAIEEGDYSHEGSTTLTAHIQVMHRRKVHSREEDDDGRTQFGVGRASCRARVWQYV